MDANAAKLIGAGLATISLAGVGVFGNVLLGFALTEAVALYALVIAMLLLFVF
jgi:F0F1-type ATP synthase membrane subunit c/vacuolar-type H+-ATPase subunit K